LCCPSISISVLAQNNFHLLQNRGNRRSVRDTGPATPIGLSGKCLYGRLWLNGTGVDAYLRGASRDLDSRPSPMTTPI
jgi:hypothetical protein